MNTASSNPLPAASLSAKEQELAALRTENAALKHRVEWFEKQLFGRKSEKQIEQNPHQHALLGDLPEPPPVEGERVTITYERGKAKKQRPDDCVNDSGLRFNDQVPVEVISILPPELKGAQAKQFEIIGTKYTYRLAQRPASYVVLKYERPVIKRKDSETPLTTPAPFNVLDNSVADVSFLVGLLVDKFQYHLPLYRQHQRLQQSGVTLSRATLTNLVKRAISLLRPVVAAQLDNVLRSRVLAMDETPIKAGRKSKGKMKSAWFWPVYGEEDEVVFTYSESRGRQHIEKVLRESFKGTLISDGYAAYARYAEQSQGVTHAQCWVHSRRYFVEAEAQEPEAVAQALALIGRLYTIEGTIEKDKLTGEKKGQYRLDYSKPVVDRFFEWCQQQIRRSDLTPSHPLTRALKYVLSKEHKLRVFLEDPDVPMDTNHLERVLRPIPMGRKNWMFCWTELGAEHVGTIQSLISTCKLHDINPYAYLTDILLRISDHPASEVADLTPRRWKTKFAETPLQSDLYSKVNDAVE